MAMLLIQFIQKEQQDADYIHALRTKKNKVSMDIEAQAITNLHPFRACAPLLWMSGPSSVSPSIEVMHEFVVHEIGTLTLKIVD